MSQLTKTQIPRQCRRSNLLKQLNPQFKSVALKIISRSKTILAWASKVTTVQGLAIWHQTRAQTSGLHPRKKHM